LCPDSWRNMAKTKIEWTDHTVNPVKGICPVGCSYCYARRLYKRFAWNPEIRYDDYWFEQLPKRRGCRIFVGSTMELFGPWIRDEWLSDILYRCSRLPDTTFLFLTKSPENLARWSPFPGNVHIGVTATDSTSFSKATDGLIYVKAEVKFISIEPVLAPVRFYPGRLPYCGINWLIIGQQTPVSKATMPKVEDIAEIVEAADKAGVKVFLKDNLRPLLKLDEPLMGQAALDIGLLNWAGELRQEIP